MNWIENNTYHNVGECSTICATQTATLYFYTMPLNSYNLSPSYQLFEVFVSRYRQESSIWYVENLDWLLDLDWVDLDSGQYIEQYAIDQWWL